MYPLIVALSSGHRVGGYELDLGADMPWYRLAGVTAAVRCARAVVLISVGGEWLPSIVRLNSILIIVI
jgi:hypothetical protein